ncbi:BTB domain containing protein [Pyrenophora tritici-repentis]|nr:BTB domain containing protein [Pyrenophora tritici-repentis]KAF7569339.1 BTB domain containing protein [Pyrenophora tritici-repentis]KAI0584048.1 BTB domain-containing protein [Pyrenophora tritici-repentis]KAI0622454.1 BTB domain-containing protein [Pyrenophora tritici-repentis]KAI1538816.1 BTB domain containing protein [Pyrenophora tritici-repentis]
MPPITVPCCAPYVPPVFTTNSKDVIFKVGHGSECKEFEVEAALVRACPGCFRDWLKKNQKNPNKEMALPDEKPAVFSVFVAFLKTGTIVIPSDDHDTKDDTDEGRSEDIDKDMNDDVYEERNSDTDDPHTNTYIDEGTQTPAIHMLIPLFTFAKDH